MKIIFLFYLYLYLLGAFAKKPKAKNKNEDPSDVSSTIIIPQNLQYPTQVILFGAHEDIIHGVIHLTEIKLTAKLVATLNISDVTNLFNDSVRTMHKVSLDLKSMDLAFYEVHIYESGSLVNGCDELRTSIAFLGSKSSSYKVAVWNSSFHHHLFLPAVLFRLSGEQSVVGKPLAMINATSGEIHSCGIIAYTGAHVNTPEVNKVIFVGVTALCVLLCLLIGCICYRLDGNQKPKKQYDIKQELLLAKKPTDKRSFDAIEFSTETSLLTGRNVFTQPPVLVHRDFSSSF